MSSPTRHYIGMAGLRGCIPQYCEVFASIADATASLAQVHDLSAGYMARLLGRARYTNLNLHKHGNEYAEIVECECATPWVHSENMQEGEEP